MRSETKQPDEVRIDRRAALKWIGAAASTYFLSHPIAVFGQATKASEPGGAAPAPSLKPDDEVLDRAGYGLDPDLLKDYKPGELWPLTLTAEQRTTSAVLADLIIPADEFSPNASSVGVVDFIDEWISAPYRPHRRDRALLLDGLLWLDQEATRRFAKPFRELAPAEHAAICDDICYLYRASEEHLLGARFFALFRDLTAGGFYTTPIGWKDVRYVGNLPNSVFAGPPDSVLKKLGIE